MTTFDSFVLDSKLADIRASSTPVAKIASFAYNPSPIESKRRGIDANPQLLLPPVQRPSSIDAKSGTTHPKLKSTFLQSRTSFQNTANSSSIHSVNVVTVLVPVVVPVLVPVVVPVFVPVVVPVLVWVVVGDVA